MSTQYERSLNLKGLTFDELMVLKRERQAESAQLFGRSSELNDQIARIDAALRQVERP